jgi:Reverse transcriptase (RNA-dependent DNA polymerase)
MQTGGQLCHQSSKTWNKRNFGKSFLNTSISAPQNVIGAQWVSTKKAHGQFRARCVAKGFSQISGKDFQENRAPVISDTTLHLLLAIKTAFKLSSG